MILTNFPNFFQVEKSWTQSLKVFFIYSIIFGGSVGTIKIIDYIGLVQVNEFKIIKTPLLTKAYQQEPLCEDYIPLSQIIIFHIFHASYGTSTSGSAPQIEYSIETGCDFKHQHIRSTCKGSGNGEAGLDGSKK